MGAKIPLVEETQLLSYPQRGPPGLSLQSFLFLVLFSFQSHLAVPLGLRQQTKEQTDTQMIAPSSPVIFRLI